MPEHIDFAAMPALERFTTDQWFTENSGLQSLPVRRSPRVVPRGHNRTGSMAGRDHLVTAAVKAGMSDLLVVKGDITGMAGVVPPSVRQMVK